MKHGSIGVLQVGSGISEGTSTAVVGSGIEEGMEVIIGLTQVQAADAPTATNPFQQAGSAPGGSGFGGVR